MEFIWLFILLLATPACLTTLYLPYANGLILAALNVFGLFWSTLIISILVYRASPWHPLAKYPGPLICKLSKYHLAFLSLRGKQYLYYSQLHKKYGDVVRIGALWKFKNNIPVYPICQAPMNFLSAMLML